MYMNVLPICLNLPQRPFGFSQRPKEGIRSPWNWSYRWSHTATWVLGSEIRFSVGALSTPNCWAICPVSFIGSNGQGVLFLGLSWGQTLLSVCSIFRRALELWRIFLFLNVPSLLLKIISAYCNWAALMKTLLGDTRRKGSLCLQTQFV